VREKSEGRKGKREGGNPTAGEEERGAVKKNGGRKGGREGGKKEGREGGWTHRCFPRTRAFSHSSPKARREEGREGGREDRPSAGVGMSRPSKGLPWEGGREGGREEEWEGGKEEKRKGKVTRRA
jgi:hypothetical protein